MPVQSWPCRVKRMRLSILSHLLLWVWLGGSLIWVAWWARFYYLYCDIGPTFACVLGGFLQTVFYSLPQVLERVFGPPALVLLLGLAVHQVLKICRRPGPRGPSDAEELDALGSR
jgi:hypothetical protein